MAEITQPLGFKEVAGAINPVLPKGITLLDANQISEYQIVALFLISPKEA